MKKKPASMTFDAGVLSIRNVSGRFPRLPDALPSENGQTGRSAVHKR
jgi:hypothetical protein